jgi:hypothetical protein
MSPRRRLLSEEAIGTSSEEVMTQACQNGIPHKRPVVCVLYATVNNRGEFGLQLTERNPQLRSFNR